MTAPDGTDRSASTAGVDDPDDTVAPAADRRAPVVAALAAVALPSRSRDVAAEVTGLLRWSARAADGRVVAVLDSRPVAVRLVALLARLGITDGSVSGSGTPRRWWVTVEGEAGADLARRTGMVDVRGRATGGVAPWLVTGSLPGVVATVRGALLAAGRVREDDHGDAVVELDCPTAAAARGFAELGLRLGVHARTTRGGSPRLEVRGPDEAGLLLGSCGGGATLVAAGLTGGAARGPSTPEDTSANATRAAVAASRSTSTVADAFAVLEAAGVTVPAPMASAGRLRLAHPELGLADLAARAEGSVSKDVLAGRLRRLSALAARHRRRQHRPAPTGDATG